MVFILSALWWIRIRGLWKLPDGRDWLWGNLSLVLMGRAMLSKSLIQFSVDGCSCVPSLLVTWGQTMVEAEKRKLYLSVKKAEHWRIDAVELWCWRRLLRVPWIARRSNQSILKEISPEYSLEGLMFKLKLQYFGYLMRRADSFEKTLSLGLFVMMKVKESESEVAQLCLTLCDPVAHQAFLSMGFSRREYWGELPFPSPGDLPDPEIEPGSPHCRQMLYPLSHQGSPSVLLW